MDGIPEHAPAPDAERARAWHQLGIVQLQEGRLDAARGALEKSVALDPTSAELRNNLAILLQKLGRADLAAEQYAAGLAYDRDNPDIHANLASALALLGRYDDALTHIGRALALRPDLVSPYIHAAIIESERGHHGSALQWIERILPAIPENVDALVLRANILRRLDRGEEGLATCWRALELQPDCDRAYNMLGLLLKSRGHDEEALASFEKAASLSAEPDGPIANRANLLIELGRDEEASTLLADAIPRHPRSAELWYARGQIGTVSFADPEIRHMEAMLHDDGSVTHVEREQLHYTLGAAHLRIGDAERGFHHFAAGARMKRTTILHDQDETERWMARIAAAFPRDLYDRLAGGDESELPVFVIGMPRSGTTLVEQILASHPEIHGAGEPRFLENALRRSIVANQAPAYPGFVAQYGRAELDAMAADYLAQLTATAPGATRIIDKMVYNLFHAGLIPLLLPRARIIHCRRDPIDTCLSCYTTLFTGGQEYSYDLTELGRHYRAYEKLVAHWRAILPPDRFIEVDYEQVVENLEDEARRLIAFCGLDWSPACLRFHETQRPVRTASMAQVRQPIYRSSIGRGRRYAAYLGPLLQALGLPTEP